MLYWWRNRDITRWGKRIHFGTRQENMCFAAYTILLTSLTSYYCLNEVFYYWFSCGVFLGILMFYLELSKKQWYPLFVIWSYCFIEFANGHLFISHLSSQADICHAYQLLIKDGLKDENIIVFMYDDIAFNEENPRPGIIINKPDGSDVYNGVPKVGFLFLRPSNTADSVCCYNPPHVDFLVSGLYWGRCYC